MIHPDELTFDQQVTYFARARVIAGPHGAGLNNAMFARTKCLVVDILPDTWSPTWVLQETQLFGQHYLPVAYPIDPALSHRSCWGMSLSPIQGSIGFRPMILPRLWSV